MEAGGLVPIAAGIIEQQPPTLVAAPPLQSRREQVRAAMWSRVASRGANLRRMTNANEDSEDARLTRGVVNSVMYESWRAASIQQEAAGASSSAPPDEDSEDEMVRALELEMTQGGPPEEGENDALTRLLDGVRRIEEVDSI